MKTQTPRPVFLLVIIHDCQEMSRRTTTYHLQGYNHPPIVSSDWWLGGNVHTSGRHTATSLLSKSPAISARAANGIWYGVTRLIDRDSREARHLHGFCESATVQEYLWRLVTITLNLAIEAIFAAQIQVVVSQEPT
jgi:hypothetical protein